MTCKTCGGCKEPCLPCLCPDGYTFHVKGSIQWAVAQREAGHTLINKKGLVLIGPSDSKVRRFLSEEDMRAHNWYSSVRMPPLDGWEIEEKEE